MRRRILEKQKKAKERRTEKVDNVGERGGGGKEEEDLNKEHK